MCWVIDRAFSVVRKERLLFLYARSGLWRALAKARYGPAKARPPDRSTEEKQAGTTANHNVHVC